MNENDLFQLMNVTDNMRIDGLYEGGKYLRFKFDGNKIYLNNELYGQIVRSVDDLPLAGKLKFLYTDIAIPENQLRKQTDSNLSVSLGPKYPLNRMINLPPQIKYLRAENPNLVDLRYITFLSSLKGLDLAGNENINPEQLLYFKNLRHLNLSATGLSNLSDISKMKNLESLNISENELSNLNGLELLPNLRSLNIDSNYHVQSLNSIISHPKLTNVSDDKISLLDRNERDKMNRNLRRNRDDADRVRETSITPKGFLLDKIIMVMIFFVLVFMLYIMLRLAKRKTPKLKLEDGVEFTPTGVKTYANEIKEIDKLVAKEQLYQPKEKNALRQLTSLMKIDPKNNNLKEKNKELHSVIRNKINKHQKRNEVEPVYIMLLPVRIFNSIVS